MIKNYFKVAWRYMWHNKAFSALNIAGLSAGMAVALLIGLWIYGQYSYDRFLPAYDRLYQIKLNFNYNGQIQTQSGSALPVVDALRKNYPEVKYATATDWGAMRSLIVGDKRLTPAGRIVGVDFLHMFGFPIVKGVVFSASTGPNSIILTETVAKALFAGQDPLGKIIRVDNKNEVMVIGVMKDMPANSTLQPSYLLPDTYGQPDPAAKTQWTNYSFPEYLELQPGTNVAAFENKIRHLLAGHDPQHQIDVVLQPARNWRLLTEYKDGKPVGGFIQYVRMFGIIGLLVLVIAGINFVNLSTARAEKRAREVGVRKAIGSLRSHLIIQFLSEALLVTFVALVFAIVLVLLVLPAFSALTGSVVQVPYSSPVFWGLMVGYALLTGLLAGSWPAFYLSSFNSVTVLKGTIRQGRWAALPRKIFVVVQFTCSIALVISTLIIYQQIGYAKDRPKGYDADRLVVSSSSDDLNKNYDALKNDLLASGLVTSVTKAGSGMLFMPASFTIFNWPGKKAGESLEMFTTGVSKDFFKTVGIRFAAGGDFAGGEGADTLNLILNEAAAQRLHLAEPINQLITFEYTSHPMRVIGVVKNALIGSPFHAATPAIYVYNPGWAGVVLYRLAPDVHPQEAITRISAIFNKYNPAFPFDFRFADEAFNGTFQMVNLVGTLAGIFAGLAIFISCLGLFGLMAYVAEQRKKEISIRKVLGASVGSVWLLLSSDFLVLIGVSAVIASPIAYYYLHGWLAGFDYRIVIGPAAFLYAAALTLVITLVTISYQAIGSALANPVKSLRSE